MTSIVDLGRFVGLPTYVFDSLEGSSVAGVDSKAEVVGQKESGSYPSPYQAFFLDNNGVSHDLGPQAGYAQSFATAINENGLISGFSEKTAGSGIGATTSHEAFLYSDGTLTDLGTLGGNDSIATSVSDSGSVVGYSTTSTSSGGATHAFLYGNGAMTDLPPSAGFSASYATGISDSGQIAGYLTQGTSGADHAALYDNEKWTDLGTLASYPESYATAINSSGQIVGYSATRKDLGSAAHAFLWSEATGMHDLGTLPGYQDSHATAISDSGVIVGYAHNPGNGGLDFRAFMEVNGTMTDLNSLLPNDSGWRLYTATAINNQGVIVGMGDHDGYFDGYVLYGAASGSTSTPLPTQPAGPTSNPTTKPRPNPSYNPGVTAIPPTPRPAARPLPAGFLRTPPVIQKIATRVIDGAPEIVLRLDQGIASKLATKKLWYSVQMSRTEPASRPSSKLRVAISKVVYQPRTHTINLLISNRSKVHGDVTLMINTLGIVNLLGQPLEGDGAAPGMNFVRTVKLR